MRLIVFLKITMFKIFIRKLVNGLSWNITNIKWSDKIITRDQVDYITALNELYNEVENIPGHIIELGVGRARNAIIFGSLIKKKQQEKFKKYFGFDTFDNFPNEDLKESPHLYPLKLTELDKYEYIKDFIFANKLEDVITLIKGDIINTLPKFLVNAENKYNFDKLLISLVYIDCNSYRAASFSLDNLKRYFSKGTLIVVDESRLGDETLALKNFCDENKLEFKSTKYKNHISSYAVWNS
jgi:hypothetical protein